MSTTDGNSTTRPLRRRKSKRFDRSGGSPLATGSTVLDTDDAAADDDVDLDLPETAPETSDPDPVAMETPLDIEEDGEAGAGDGGSDETSALSTSEESELPAAGEDAPQDLRSDRSGRNRTVEQMSLCGRCGHDVSTVDIEVDGNVLMMESCDNCDTRRWQLAGEPVELQQALDHVGEHAGRRR